jgi:hypothetical protein
LLGLAALVAVYFWVPLVWGWFGKRDPNMTVTPVQTGSTTTPAVTTVAVTMPVGASASQAATKPARPSWQQVTSWMHDDQRTMTAPPLTQTRDPFQPAKIEVVETKPIERLKPRLPIVTLSASGLTLTSTIIGPQRRIARINGKTYGVGQTITVAKDKEAPVTFKLIEVKPRHAVLEAEGQRFELSIPEPTKSNRIELLGETGE